MEPFALGILLTACLVGMCFSMYKIGECNGESSGFLEGWTMCKKTWAEEIAAGCEVIENRREKTEERMMDGCA